MSEKTFFFFSFFFLLSFSCVKITFQFQPIGVIFPFFFLYQTQSPLRLQLHVHGYFRWSQGGQVPPLAPLWLRHWSVGRLVCGHVGLAVKCELWAYGLVQIRMCSCAVLWPVGRLCSAVCTMQSTVLGAVQARQSYCPIKVSIKQIKKI